MTNDLEDMSGVGPATLDTLNEIGIESVSALAQCELEDLVEDDGPGFTEKKASKLLGKAQEKGVIIRSGSDAAEEDKKRGYVSSGIDNLDELLGGGWREGTVHAIGGPAASGKTQNSFKSMVNAVEESGGNALYIETEPNRYSPDRLQQLASEDDVQERIYLIQAWSLEEQGLSYDTAREQLDDLSLVVVDSFTSQFRLSEQFEGRGSFSERSAVISRHIQSLQKLAIEHNVPVILIAQAYGNPKPYSEDFTLYGGSVFDHSVGVLLKTRRKKELTEIELEKHPSQGPDEVLVNITDDDLESVN